MSVIRKGNPLPKLKETGNLLHTKINIREVFTRDNELLNLKSKN